MTSNKNMGVYYRKLKKTIFFESLVPVLTLTITYTTQCPYSCNFCYLSNSQRNEIALPNYLFIDRLIEIIKKYDIPFVDVLGGEPFSKENIDYTRKLMSRLNENNIKYHVATVGANIIQEDYDLFKKNVSVSISWHGFKEKEKGLNLSNAEKKSRQSFLKYLQKSRKNMGCLWLLQRLTCIKI